jgi:hypothetical protein
MKLLIVENNSTPAALTAKLLHSLDGQAQQIEAITLASDLQTAVLCLPEHDAVLCEGTFPLSHNSLFLAEDWDVVRQEANRRGIHFVLYSGSVRALECARDSSTLALAKPAAIEDIHAALTHRPLPVVAKSPRESARMAESLNLQEKTMPQIFEDCSRKLPTEGDALARRAEAPSRVDHLLAFNFGRSVGRMENARDTFWLRVRWLLLGAAVGVTVAAVYLQNFLSQRILPFAK